NIMLKAGSLLYALSICLILALISGSLILFSYYNQLENENYRLLDKVNRNALSGFNYLLSDLDFKTNDKIKIDLFNSGEDSVDLEVRNWGLFHVALSHCKIKNFETYRIGLLGKKFDVEGRIALYLADKNSPLLLCGKTFIRGI